MNGNGNSGAQRLLMKTALDLRMQAEKLGHLDEDGALSETVQRLREHALVLETIAEVAPPNGDAPCAPQPQWGRSFVVPSREEPVVGRPIIMGAPAEEEIDDDEEPGPARSKAFRQIRGGPPRPPKG